MKVDKLLVETQLSKDTVEGLTKAWFAIKNAPAGTKRVPGTELFDVLDELDKKLRTYKKPDGSDGTKLTERERREEYDKLYDAATEEFFGHIKSVAGFDELKDFMRSQWLKMGFEAGDGTNEAMQTAMETTLEANANPMNTENSKEMVDLIVNRMSKSDVHKLSTNEDARKLLAHNKSFWSYPMDDIARAIKVFLNTKPEVYKAATDTNPFFAGDKGPNSTFSNEVTNIRGWESAMSLAGEYDDSDTVEVKKLNDNKTGQDLVDYLEKGGVNFKKAEDVDLLLNIATKAKEQL